MKPVKFLIVGLCLFLTSCGSVSYFGNTLAPTTSVDIYYSAHDVKKDYNVIGHLSFVNYFQADQEHIKTKLSAYAKKIGADGIIIVATTAVEDAADGIVKADALKYK